MITFREDKTTTKPNEFPCLHLRSAPSGFLFSGGHNSPCLCLRRSSALDRVISALYQYKNNVKPSEPLFAQLEPRKSLRSHKSNTQVLPCSANGYIVLLTYR